MPLQIPEIQPHGPQLHLLGAGPAPLAPQASQEGMEGAKHLGEEAEPVWVREAVPGLEGQGDVGELIPQGQEVQAHSWQVGFSKAVGVGPNLGQQLPGELQADPELLPQLLQAQGGPPWRSRESPDTSSSQEQGEQQKAEPWREGEVVGQMRAKLERNSCALFSLCSGQALCAVSLTPHSHQ